MFSVLALPWKRNNTLKGTMNKRTNQVVNVKIWWDITSHVREWATERSQSLVHGHGTNFHWTFASRLALSLLWKNWKRTYWTRHIMFSLFVQCHPIAVGVSVLIDWLMWIKKNCCKILNIFIRKLQVKSVNLHETLSMLASSVGCASNL